LLLPVRVSDVQPPGLLKFRIYADPIGRDATASEQRCDCSAKDLW